MVKRTREDESSDYVGAVEFADEVTDAVGLDSRVVATPNLISDGDVECSYCESRFPSYPACEIHVMMAHQNTCSSCGKVFPTDYILNLHIDEHHNVLLQMKMEKGDAGLHCFVEQCRQMFYTSTERKFHLISEHYYPADYPFSITDKGI